MEDHFSTTVAKVSKARLIPPAESFDGSSSRRLGDALSHPQISLTRQNSYVQLFNTSGELYREMKISEKLETLSEDAALDLLAANGKLVKRPFVLTSETGLVGFKEEEWKKVC